MSSNDGSNSKLDQSTTPDRSRVIGSSGVKRAESMRVTGVPSGPSSLSAADASRLKRNPSFTTRKRTSSLRKPKIIENQETIEMGGYLDRKHEQQSGGKRAAIRSWKTYYTGNSRNRKSVILLVLICVVCLFFSYSIVWSVAVLL